MSVEKYLPSQQFRVISGSITLSIALVWGTYALTRPPQQHVGALVATSGSSNTNETNWQASLDQIQAQQASHLPPSPDQKLVDSLLTSAQSPNITDSVGKSLLINVTNARAQGLGADQPTQDQLVASAIGQLQAVAQPLKLYVANQVTIVPDSKDTLRVYANNVALVLPKHPHANMSETINILGNKINGQGDQLNQLPQLAKDYQGLAKDFAKIPVPASVAQYHLAIINDYIHMADSYSHMQELGTDPLRGLAGLQIYNKTAEDAQSMFINITQVLAKNGILFTKGDPGASLQSMLSGQ